MKGYGKMQNKKVFGDWMVWRENGLGEKGIKQILLMLSIANDDNRDNFFWLMREMRDNISA
jgi:hypothetical protein